MNIARAKPNDTAAIVYPSYLGALVHQLRLYTLGLVST